jgi:hypothetical protein
VTTGPVPKLNNQLIRGRLASPSTSKLEQDRLHAVFAIAHQASDHGLDPAGAVDAVNGTAFWEEGRVLHFEASDAQYPLNWYS